MNDDILRQMTRALSEQYDGATAVPEATRARVIRTLAERRPRRKRWFSLGIPLFVVLGGSTAWAAATGQLERIVESAARVVQWQTQETLPPTDGIDKKRLAGVGQWRPSPPAEALEPAVAPDEEPENRAEEVPPLLPSRQDFKDTRPNEKAKAHLSAVDVRRDSKPVEAVSEEDHAHLLLFRSAHRAQFSDGDCSRAISIYERYLLLNPKGPFNLEAKYNRGVCLVRTGRHQAGRAALEPFAQGVYGDYRRSQSAEILQALSAADLSSPPQPD